jgi:hypothetical protein
MPPLLTDAVILLLRLGMVAVLYVFLLALVAALRRELRRAAIEAEGEAQPGHLLVLDPGSTAMRPGQAFRLQLMTSLGREPTNTLVLSDASVSARHAVLTWRDGGWWVRDLGSTNGTFVNQQRVEGDVPVDWGGVVGLGRVRFKLSQ